MRIFRIQKCSITFHLSVISVIFLYFLMFSIFWFWTYRTNLAHRKQEREKDEKYKEELLIAAKKAEAANRGEDGISPADES